MSNTFQQEVIQQLKQNGSDLAKPHGFEFHLSIPTQTLADKCADKFRRSGFTADVTRSGSAWLCIAKKTLVPATANLADHARFFNEIATAVGGEFDGWEAEIV